MDIGSAAKQLIEESETLLEYSHGRPRVLLGGGSLAMGCIIGADAVRYLLVSRWGVPVLLGALALAYLGVRCLFFQAREFVCVTDKRVLYQKTDWCGRPGRLSVFLMGEIAGVRLCRSSVMFGKGQSGEIILELRGGKSCMLPFLQNGEHIMEAIGEELSKFSGQPAEKEAGSPTSPCR